LPIGSGSWNSAADQPPFRGKRGSACEALAAALIGDIDGRALPAGVGFLGLHFSKATLSPGRPCFVIPNQFVLRLEILADCVSIVTLKRDRKLIPSSPSMSCPYVA
jgi:hypothetical protein